MTISVFHLPDPHQFERLLVTELHGAEKPLAEWRQFPNREWFVSVRDVTPKCIVIGRYEAPADHFLQTNLLIDTLKRNGAQEVILVLPQLSYSRQDRQVNSGDPVSAMFVTKAAAAAGADRIVTLDLHSPRLFDVVPMPIHDVSLMPVFADAVRQELDGDGKGKTVVCPDRGAITRCRRFAELIDCPNQMWVEKSRTEDGQAIALRAFGKRVGDVCMIVDDQVDTGGTVAESARLAREAGFQRLFLCATHAVLSGNAVDVLAKCDFERIFFSDSLPLADGVAEKIPVTVVPSAVYLAEAVRQWL